jgi:hypothetical protein
MATAAEQTFIRAVNAAEGTRQAAKAAAFATYAFVPANLAAYNTALVAADVAFETAVVSAATTAGLTPFVVPEGPFGGNIATIGT